MAAQKGKNLLLKVNIGGTYTTIGGIRAKSISVNGSPIDITNSESNEWRQLKDVSDAKSVAINGSGVFLDDASISHIENLIFTNKLESFRVIFENEDQIDGSFKITNLSYDGSIGDTQSYSIGMESAGNITFTRKPGFLYEWIIASQNAGVSYSNDSQGGVWAASTLAGVSAQRPTHKPVYGNGVWLLASTANDVWFRSTDGGENFTGILQSGLNTRQTSSFATDGLGNWMMGQQFREGAISVDGGLTWTSITTAIQASGGSTFNHLEGLIRLPSGTYVACGVGGFFRTTDFGTSFTYIASAGGGVGHYAMDMSGTDTIKACMEWYRMMGSTGNDGAGWTFDFTASRISGAWWDIAYNSDDDIWMTVGSSYSSAIQVWTNRSGGGWNNDLGPIIETFLGSTSVTFYGVAYANGAWVLCGIDGVSAVVIRTLDNGATWEDLSSQFSGGTNLLYGIGVAVIPN